MENNIDRLEKDLKEKEFLGDNDGKLILEKLRK
jgi:hypothetical protein